MFVSLLQMSFMVVVFGGYDDDFHDHDYIFQTRFYVKDTLDFNNKSNDHENFFLLKQATKLPSKNSNQGLC